ncbi:ATP-binding protein [Streptomyces buecherae]|uniref:SCO6881 family protein n=1 Tax=Streptomyces buecherae TaxID=2763006 RepID=UPI00367E0DC0
MGVCEMPLMGSVCDAVDFVTNPAGTVTDGIGAWIAKSAGELAASAADLAVKAVDTTTAIDLNARWFRENYELLLPIGLTLTVGTFCIQLLSAAWRRDERALAQAGMGTMIGVLFSFCAIAFTSVAITVVDALSAGLFQAANTSLPDAIRRVVKVSQLGAMFGLGWAVPAVVAVGFTIGAFLYWGVMVARKVGVLILVALAVFAGSGGGWEVAKRWRRGWIEATATLVVSKLLMSVVFLIGVSAMGQSDSDDGMAALSDAMAGIVIMALVLFCPYITYKFVHWATDSGGHDDLHRSGIAGFAAPAAAAKGAATLAVQANMGAPAPQGPSKVPGTGGSGVASGINPAGAHLSKEGINTGPGKPPTSFRYGENSSAPGDKGRPLIQRPGLPPLVTRPGATMPGAQAGAGADSADALASASLLGSEMERTGAASTGGPAPGSVSDPVAPAPPATGTTGSAASSNWVYPNPPPSGP